MALLESLIAILIFSLGILGVVGMQANAMKASNEAKYRSMAAAVAQKRIDELWTMTAADRALATEIDTDISTASGLPSGKRTTRRADPSDAFCSLDTNCFTVAVTWSQAGTNETRRLTTIGYVTPP